MKTTRKQWKRIGIVALQILFLANHASAQETNSDPSRPGRVIGRLTGWGFIGSQSRVEDTLPTGWEAENIIQVFAGSTHWLALKSDRTVISNGKLPSWLGKVRDIDVGTSWKIAVTDEGKVAVWDHKDERISAPAEALTDVIDVEGGFQCALALRSDGTVAYWGPAYDSDGDPTDAAAIERLTAFLDRELHDVVAISSKQFSCAALRRDGSAVAWSVKGSRPFSESWLKATNIRQIETGSEGSLLAIHTDNTVSKAFDPKRDSVPADLGPVRWVQTSLGGFAMARRQDGTFRQWSDAKYIRFDTSPEKYENFLAVAFGGSYDARSKASFVVGIEPSYVQGFSQPTTHQPDILQMLKEAESERQSVGSDITAFENRYLAELGKLKKSAAKNIRPKIVSLIDNEIAHFRDRTRPAIEQPEVVARFQKIYREGAPALEEKKQAQYLGVYESVVSQLQALQDEFTQSKQLQVAVLARAEKEKIAAALAFLRENHSVPSAEEVPATSAGQNGAPSLKPIPDGQKIFSISDPRVPGELVVAGTIGGHAVTIPDSGDARRVIDAEAGADKWYALRPNGTAFGVTNTGAPLALPSDLPRLERIRDVGHKIFGYDTRGRFYLSEEANVFQPPVPLERIVSLEPRPLPHDYFVALLDDGSVTSWGPHYDREKFTWKVPLEVTALRDVTQVAVCFNGMAALRKNGSVVAWGGGEGLLDAPIDGPPIVKLIGAGDVFVALREDGTVTAWRPGDSVSVVESVPQDLTDVVDIAGGYGLGLALRANGTWVGWGENPDGVLLELDKIRGARWLAVGGKIGERFFVGIKPDPADLKK